MLLANGDIYFDYNATTPIDPWVLEAMQIYLSTSFGNPSSNHSMGNRNRAAIEEARAQVANLLGCEPGEIIFTSGGSESNNLALKGLAAKYAHRGMHIIVSAVEHPSIIEVCHYLTREGFRVSYLPVDDQGVVSSQDLSTIITSKTILVSVMHANNEVGSIQPISELADIAHEAGAVFHTDAAQSVAKIPTRVDELKCDLLTVAGHKLYAPKGIGALFLKKGTQLAPLIHGAGQEGGLRAGTENVAYIVGLGKAAEVANETLQEEMKKIKILRDILQSDLKKAFPEIRINASKVDRLPNTLSISFPNISALQIMDNLKGLAISAGAACHSGDGKGSGVLEAMGVDLNYQLGTLRLSLGRFVDEYQVKRAVEIVQIVQNKLANSQKSN
ncbi:MAG: cysteine desulfurase [Candidatus Marinimicrobia bacterium]|nr:cysteine desulfurase [Candidatus Neomarinimicrobiota bacterium]